MAWFPGTTIEAPAFERWLAHRPELNTLYKRFYGTFWDDALLPRSLLEMCRVRIAQLHDCDAELLVSDPLAELEPPKREAIPLWEHSESFSPAERAALAIAEKFPWAHHSISDEEHAELANHFDERQIVALTVALALFDANCRLRLVFDLEGVAAETTPGSAAGPLH